MTELHINDFCHDSAQALVQLYHSFPRPRALYVADIAGIEERDELGLYPPRHMACLSTLLWLADEGFIRYTTLIYEEGIEQAVLTHAIFVLLSHQQVPAALCADKGTSNWVKNLTLALREQDSQRLSTLMHHFLAAALTLPKNTSTPHPTVVPPKKDEKAALPTIEEMFSSL